MSNSGKENCGHCKFFTTQPDDIERKNGNCVRFPPTAHAMQAQGRIAGQAGVALMGISPPVAATFWCGEWKPNAEIFDKRMADSLKSGD